MSDYYLYLTVTANGTYAEGLTYISPSTSAAWQCVNDSTSSSNDGDSTTIYGNQTSVHIGDMITFKIADTTLPYGYGIDSLSVYWAMKYSGTYTGSYGVCCVLNGSVWEQTTGFSSLTTSYVNRNNSISSAPGGGNWVDFYHSSTKAIEIGVVCADEPTAKSAGGHHLTNIYARVGVKAIPATTAESRIAHNVGNLILFDVKRVSNELGDLSKYSNSRNCQVVSLDSYGDPPFFDDDWYKRRLIEFEATHSKLKPNDVVKFQLYTGQEIKLPTSNGVLNEAIQHSATEIVHDPNQEVSYMVWMGYISNNNNYKQYATYFNHATQEWSDTILSIATSGAVYNTHYYPVVFLDSDGLLHYFYDAYKTAVKHRRTRNSVIDDPDNFSIMANTSYSIGTGMTYSRIVEDTAGRMYLIGRKTIAGTTCDAGIGFYKSHDKGFSWSSTAYYIATWRNSPDNYPVMYIGGCLYDTSYTPTGRLHIAINWMVGYNSTTDRKGRAITYLWSDDFENWYEPTEDTPEGVLRGQTTTIYSDAILFEDCRHAVLSGDGATWPTPPYYHTNTQALILDNQGRPAFLYFAPFEYQYNREADIYVAHWTGTQWDTSHLNDVAGAPRMLSHRNGGVIFFENNEFYVYYFGFPTNEKYFGGEIVRCKSDGNGSIWTSEYLTKNSGFGAGMMSATLNPTRYGRLIFLNRCKDLYLFNDEYYPFVQRDGDDIRIVKHTKIPGNGYVDEEVKKLIPDRFQSQDTYIYFPLVSEVPSNALNHAYNKYYVYYSNPLATGAPINVDSVFYYYEGFEQYTVNNANLEYCSDWQSDPAGFDVQSCTSLSWPLAHTNKLYSGAYSLRQYSLGTASYNFDTAYTDVWVTLQCWTEGNTLNYVELYDSATKKFSRFGCGSDYFSYYNSSDGSWTEPPISLYGFKQMNDFKIHIHSVNGCTFYGNNIEVVENTGELTQFTHLKIGSFGVTAPHVLIDHISIFPYTGSEPDIPRDIIYTASLGEEEGEADLNYGRLAHIVQTNYYNKERLSQNIGDIDLHTVEKLAQTAIIDKVSQEKIVHASIGSKHQLIKLAEFIISDKFLLAKIAEDLAVDKKELKRLCECVITVKNKSIKLANSIYMDKKVLTRLSESIILDKYLRDKLAEIVAIDKIDQSKISEMADCNKIILERLANSLLSDKTIWYRLVNKVSIDRSFMARLSEIVATNKNVLARLSESIALNKTILDRLSEDVTVDKEVVARLANLLFSDKTLLARVVGIVVSDKKSQIRQSELVELEAKEYDRVANVLISDKTLMDKIAHDLKLYDIDIYRIAEDLDLDKDEIIRLCSLAVLDKIDIKRLSNDLNIAFDKFIKICHNIAVDKEIIYRISNMAPLRAQPVIRLSHLLDIDKKTVSRITGGVVLEQKDFIRIAQYLKSNKILSERLAQILNLKATDYVRIAQIALGDKDLMIRLSEVVYTDKKLSERIAELANLSKVQEDRLSHWLSLEANVFIRITEDLNLDKVETHRLVNSVSLVMNRNYTRLSEISDTSKITTIKLPNVVPLSKFLLSRISMSFSASKTIVDRLSQSLSLEVQTNERLAHTPVASKAFLIRLSNILTVSYIEIIKLAQTISVIKNENVRFGNLVNFFIADFRNIKIISASLLVNKLIDPSIDCLSIFSPQIGVLSVKNASINNIRLVNVMIKNTDLDNPNLD